MVKRWCTVIIVPNNSFSKKTLYKDVFSSIENIDNCGEANKIKTRFYARDWTKCFQSCVCVVNTYMNKNVWLMNIIIHFYYTISLILSFVRKV